MVARVKKLVSLEAIRSASQYYIPAMIVVVAVGISIFYANHQNHQIHLKNLRDGVTEKLGAIQARLDGNIHSNIHLIHGLVAAFEAEQQEMSEARFAAMARSIYQMSSQLRSIVAAPDLVVSYAYPRQGNESVLGMDYRKNQQQHDAAIRARDSGELVVTGPVELVQGGAGLIIRYPVVKDTSGGGQMFWGLLSAVIDLEKLYDVSGLRDPGLDLDIAIVAKRASGMPTEAFFGDPSKVSDRPVIMGVDFGHESWQIFAVPKEGWDQPPPDILFFRLMAVAIGIMIVGPVLWVASLLRERHGNIATLRQREDELRALSHRLEIALEASKIGVWELDVDSRALNWDNRMKQLYGLKPDAAIDTFEVWRNALHADDLEEAEHLFQASLNTGRDYSTQFRIVCPNGEIRHMRAYGTIYRDSRFRKKIVGVNWNVTTDMALQQELREAKKQAEIQNRELERARQHMEYNSLHDALTNLPNRRYMDQHLREIDSSPGPAAAEYTLLHIDLDRFKEINDTLGHGAGDTILRHTAARLRENIRRGDFAARIGGDEFVVVCSGTAKEGDYSDLARRLIEAINTPVPYEGHECRVGASIGIATRADSHQSAEQVMINADIALYEAKRRGRNRVEHYTDTMKSLAINAKRTADAILRSIEQERFIAWFQPQFDAHSLEINGVEALARWDHPERGLLAPDSFLKVAEDLSVISQIDASILKQSLLQMTRWRAADLGIPKVSVNISAQRLFDENLIDSLKELHLEPGLLSFELLESISFDDKNDAVASAIERIKSLGIDIEIDDFGTGYASILSLLKLSPRSLKIDRQLTMPVIESPSQRRLISAIVDIGRSLSIEIVAEGVETMRHAEILRDLGCQTLQGYALAKPMSASDFLAFAKSRAWLAPKNASSA